MKSTWFVVLGAVAAVVAQDEDPESRRQSYPNCVNGTISENKVCDRTLSPPERAAALVKALTVEEKLQNLVSKAQGAPRIGLPAYNWWSEALHGVAYAPGAYFPEGDVEFNSSTSYPMPLLMAAAFDDELIEQIGTAIGVEARAWGNSGWAGLDYWTPNVNPFKDPRWGRGSETPGEDVLRVKRYAEYITRGLDGPVPGEQRRIISTCKHYAGNDFEDWNGTSRHDFDAKITVQDLAEYYLMPFQQCARDSKVGSIMCAYNAVNGVPSCANTYLLQTILREHWKWTEHNNYVTSDCEAVLDVSANHKYAPTNAAGTAICFEAGMDTSCEYSGSSDIPGAWSQGLLKEETVDRALLRLYEGLVRAGYFDGDEAVYAALDWKDVNSPEAQSLALQAAVEGIVLLKNNGTLPLDLKPSHKVAMIGFWADAPDKLQGGYSGRAAHLYSPAYAARQLGLDIAVASGPVLQNNTASDNWTAAALEAAEGADCILYFGGLDTSAAGETLDRTNLEWPEAQLTLIEKLSGLGKPLVVSLLGDQLDDTPLLELDEVSSILWANWPGQDGGVAVMKIITGEKSPAGRLPVTQYPSSYTDLIPMTDMHLRPTCKYPGRTYRWYDKPIKPFGFGLHYTTFSAEVGAAFPKTLKIADLVGGCANEQHPDTCAAPPLPVSVTNTGDRASDYVALAYLSGEYGPRPYPIKTLSAYKRLRDVAPGKTATVELPWTLGDIARHDEEGNTVLYPGEYTITIDEPTLTTATFVLEGEEAVLDRWPAPPS